MRRSAYAILLSMVADPPLALLAFEERLEEAVEIAQASIKASLTSGPGFKDCLLNTNRSLPALVIGPLGAFIRCVAVEAIQCNSDCDEAQAKLRDFVLVYLRLVLCSCLCWKRFEEVYQDFRSPETAKFQNDHAHNFLDGQRVPGVVLSASARPKRLGTAIRGGVPRALELSSLQTSTKRFALRSTPSLILPMPV